VTSIGYDAFYGCSALKTVYYGGAPSDWAKISIDSSNTLLKNATIVYAKCDEHSWNDGEITTAPTTTTEGVKTYTCTECGETKTETIPVLDEIASGTWGDLSWKIDLDGKLTISGTGAMGDFTSSSTDAWRAYKTSIKTVQIANGVTNIGNYAFYDCQNLKYAGIGNSVTSIGQGAFIMCTNLEAISNSTSLTHIGNSAFGYCYALRNITIPNGVTDIGSSAFSSCTNLTSITIPDSVTSIGDYAFNGCSALETVYYNGYKPQWNQISIGTNNTALTGATIVYAQCTGHIWNDGEITTEPTCGADGVKTFTCTVCGATKTETEPATGNHSAFTRDSSESYFAGYTEVMHYHMCGECGESICVREDPVNYQIEAPTHQSYGSYIYHCSDCGFDCYYELLPLDGSCIYGDWTPYTDVKHVHYCECGEAEYADHTWNDGEITTAPTCTATGVKTYTCTGCGATKTETVEATGIHTWNNGEITTEPTYTTEGVKTFTCTVCGETKTESVPVITDPETLPKIVVSDKLVCLGRTVRVPISIENNPGVTMMGLTVTFDTDVLELIAVEDAELLKGPTFGNVLKSPYNMIWVDPLSTEDNTGNGTIVTLVFRAKEDAVLGDTEITVTYKPSNVCNADLDKVSFAVVNGKVTVADYVIGDVNADGDVSLADVTILCRYLAGWEEYQTINTVPGDVNSDGDVSLADVTILCRYLAGWEGVTLG